MPLVQFKPGRIDHHNAQILCAVAGLLFLVRSLEDRRAGWIAGALFGLGLAVGYEAIGLVVPALALAAMVALWDSRGVERYRAGGNGCDGRHACRAGVTVAPSRWLVVHCDALSLNLPVLAGFCALACGARSACRRDGRLLGRIGAAAPACWPARPSTV